jgi:hypothetical protein
MIFINISRNKSDMKVVLTLVTMSVLVLGAGALECYKCEQLKANGEKADKVACNDASKKTCATGEDVCTTIITTFKMTVLGETIKSENRLHDCGKKSDKEETICSAREGAVKLGALGFADYDCELKPCEKDLCNSGKVAQMSFLLLAATIGLFGLFF